MLTREAFSIILQQLSCTIELSSEFITELAVEPNKLLETMEAYLVYEELQIIFNKSEVEWPSLITLFLKNRWERIKNTNLSYCSIPQHRITEACLNLAFFIVNDEISDKRTAAYQLLMPTLKELTNCITNQSLGESLIKEFILSDDNTKPINICFSLLSANNSGVLYHTTAVGQEPLARVSQAEKDRVVRHSQATQSYYQIIKKFIEKANDLSHAGGHLRRLIAGLRKGGVHGQPDKLIYRLSNLPKLEENERQKYADSYFFLLHEQPFVLYYVTKQGKIENIPLGNGYEEEFKQTLLERMGDQHSDFITVDMIRENRNLEASRFFSPNPNQVLNFYYLTNLPSQLDAYRECCILVENNSSANSSRAAVNGFYYVRKDNKLERINLPNLNEFKRKFIPLIKNRGLVSLPHNQISNWFKGASNVSKLVEENKRHNRCQHFKLYRLDNFPLPSEIECYLNTFLFIVNNNKIYFVTHNSRVIECHGNFNEIEQAIPNTTPVTHEMLQKWVIEFRDADIGISGTNEIAGSEANNAIVEFYDYYSSLPIEEKTLLASLHIDNANHSITLGNKLQELFNPELQQNSVACIEDIANDIENIVNANWYDICPEVLDLIQERDLKAQILQKVILSENYCVNSLYTMNPRVNFIIMTLITFADAKRNITLNQLRQFYDPDYFNQYQIVCREQFVNNCISQSILHVSDLILNLGKLIEITQFFNQSNALQFCFQHQFLTAEHVIQYWPEVKYLAECLYGNVEVCQVIVKAIEPFSIEDQIKLASAFRHNSLLLLEAFLTLLD